MPGRHKPHALTIAIVSQSGEALVEYYLRRAGATAYGVRCVEHAAETLPSHGAAVVFADEFGFEETLMALSGLRGRRPTVLTVVVTAEPARFSSDAMTLVLPKPVWGWTILDAIRARLERPATCGRL